MNCRNGISTLPALTPRIACSTAATHSPNGSSSRTSRAEMTRSSSGGCCMGKA